VADRHFLFQRFCRGFARDEYGVGIHLAAAVRRGQADSLRERVGSGAEGSGGAEMITMGSDISAVARDVGLTPYMARFASESMNT